LTDHQTHIQDQNRTLRFSGLVPIKRLQTTPITIIGCGALGAPVARQLAVMGARDVDLYDPDIVDEVNLGTQSFSPTALKSNKAHALKNDCRRLNPDAVVKWSAYPRPFNPSNHVPTTFYFLCVDSIATRQTIAEHLIDTAQDPLCIIDGRMNSTFYEVYTYFRLNDCVEVGDLYLSHCFFPPSEAAEGYCTIRTTLFSAITAASRMVANYAMILTVLECNENNPNGDGGNVGFFPESSYRNDLFNEF
jgi:molybdopterin/thiamine biosynthesis adenylyltransferase